MSGVCVYFQVNADEGFMLSSLILKLLEQVLSEPLFDELRTKQQLGYSVSCSRRCTDNVLGFSFEIVSPRAHPILLWSNVLLHAWSTISRSIGNELLAALGSVAGLRWTRCICCNPQARVLDELCVVRWWRLARLSRLPGPDYQRVFFEMFQELS